MGCLEVEEERVKGDGAFVRVNAGKPLSFGVGVIGTTSRPKAAIDTDALL